MTKLHAINGGGNQVDEIMVGDVKYVREDKVKAVAEMLSLDSRHERDGYAFGVGIVKAFKEEGLTFKGTPETVPHNNPTTVPKGLSNLPDEKKGNELSAILYGKLPSNLRHPARFRTFYTDFERDTGIGLYTFHKERSSKFPKGVDRSQFPYRKADSIFMVASEGEVLDYAERYEFRFSK